MTFLKKLLESEISRLRPKCERLGGTYVEGGFWKVGLHTPLMVMMGPRSALLHGTFVREVNVVVQGIETRVETLLSLLTLDLLAKSDAAGPARL